MSRVKYLVLLCKQGEDKRACTIRMMEMLVRMIQDV